MSQTTSVSTRGRAFLNRFVIGRTRSQGQLPDPNTTPPDLMDAYRAAAAKAKALFDAADRIVAQNPLPQPLAGTAHEYRQSGIILDNAVERNDGRGALDALAGKRTTAQAVLTESARLEGTIQKQKQFDRQVAQFQDLSATLERVKTTYLPDGTAKRIGRENLKPGREFRAWLDALQNLERAKTAYLADQKQRTAALARGENVDPVDKDAARALLARCDAVTAAAQQYLEHYRALPDREKNSTTSQKKQQYCTESLLTVRQFSYAVQLDLIGPPSDGRGENGEQTQGWSESDAIRVNGLRTALFFEQGYHGATSLKSEGTGGQSGSFWVRGGDSETSTAKRDETNGRLTVTMGLGNREAIFKPFEREEFPNGSRDPQGAGATKELLAYGNAGLLARMTGIDLEVPETSVTSLDPFALHDDAPQEPPLVGGEVGEEPHRPLIGSVQMHAGVSSKLEDMPPDFVNKVKPGQVQKIAILDIISLSFDRHGGNLMVDNSNPDDPRLVPIDHGATLPRPQDFRNLKDLFAGIQKEGSGTTQQNVVLQMPAAYEPFDPETVARLQLLDPDQLVEGMHKQIQALDEVHPGLGARDKVDDGSIQMSKRAAMFLKRAAATLSPAEVQIALNVHGQELFGAPDNAFDDEADRVIAEMVQKKAGYQELMLMPRDQQNEIVQWLTSNGWGVPSEMNSQRHDLLMRDPVTALKLFKAGKSGPEPTPRPTVTLRGNTQPNDNESQTLREIMQGFPGTPRSDPATRLQEWRVFDANGGEQEYQALLRATGARRDQALRGAAEALHFWTEIKRMPDTAMQRLRNVAGGQPAATVLNAAIMEELTAQRLQQARQAGAEISDAMAQSAFAQRQIEIARRILREITEAGLGDTAKAVTFLDQAQEIEATLESDPTGAERDASALCRAVSAFAIETAQMRGKAMQQQLKLLLLNEGDRKRAEDVLASVIKANSFDGLLAQIREAQELLNQGQTVDAPEDVPQIVQNDVPDQPPQPGITLQNFDWTQASAEAAKQQAIRAGLLRKKETGMTAALTKVMKARTRVEALGNGAPGNRRREALQQAMQAYIAFSRFVGSKLRGLSQHPGWAAYCNSVAEAAEQAITQTRSRLQELDEGAV